MSVLRSDETQELLHGLIQILQKRGVLPKELSQDEKNGMVDTLMHSMDEQRVSLSGEELAKNPALFKKLEFGLLAAYIHKNDPTFKFDFGLLFKKDRDLTEEDRLTLKMGIKNLLKAAIAQDPDLENNPGLMKQYDESIDQIATLMTENTLLQNTERGAEETRQANRQGIQEIVSGLGSIIATFSTPGVLGSPGENVVSSLTHLSADGLSKTEEDALGVSLSGRTPQFTPPGAVGG
jgi:hypothetical protein